VGRVLFVCSLGGLVAWRGLGIRATSYRNAQAVMARYGAALFGVWALAQYVAVWAFSTIRAAALADERRIGSLPLARITRMGDGGIVLGWFASVMGRALFTIALAVPVLAMARAFGGFTMAQVAVVSLVTLVAAAHAAAFTLMVAALFPSTGSAVVCSVMAQAAGAAVCFFAVEERGYSGVWISGPAVLSAMMEGGAFELGHLVGFVLSRGIGVAGFLCFAAVLLRWQAPRPGLYLARPVKRALKAADRLFLRLAENRQVLWRPGLGPCKSNPVLWRERAVSVLGQRDHMIRLFYGPVIGLMALALLALPVFGYRAVVTVGALGLLVVPSLVFGVYIMLVAPAGAFARERQQGTLALMALTPLRARGIVFGKYLAILRVIWIPSVLLVFFAGGTWFMGQHPMALIVLVVLGLAPVVSAQVMYASAGTRHTARGIAAGAVLVVGAAVLLLPELGRDLTRATFRQAFRGMGGLDFAPAAVLAITAAVLGRRVRLLTHAGVLAGLVLIPLVAMRLANPPPGPYPVFSMTPRVGTGTPIPSGLPAEAMLVLGYALLVSAVLIVGGFLLRKPRAWISCGMALALVFGISWFISWFPQTAQWLFLAALCAALWRALCNAGPRVFSRTALALVVPWVVAAALGFPHWQLLRSRGFDPSSAAWTVLLLAVTGSAFLVGTVLQLDRLMERNG